MTELDAFLRQARTRSVLRRIADGTHALMPCGDIRVALNLLRRDLVAFCKPTETGFTTSYKLTAKGREAVANHIPDTILHTRNQTP